MQVTSKDYSVTYEPESVTIAFQGSLRLSGLEGYAPILQLLNSVLEQNPARLILDLRQLNLLNSSGITALSKFIIQARQKQTVEIVAKGNPSIPWHEKSIKNLQRLMPTLHIEIF